MVARGRSGRLGEAYATEGVCSAASALGDGTLLCLDWPQPQDEQGLREALCKWGSVRICCHESPHAEAIGSHLRPFHTVSPRNRVNKLGSWVLTARPSGRISMS